MSAIRTRDARPQRAGRSVVVAVETVEPRLLFAANYTPNETLVSRTYYVNAATGSDGYDGLAETRAFATVRKGLEMARDSGVNVKVRIADGTYSDPNGEISFDYGPNKSQVFVIEGQSRDGVKITTTNTASGGYLYFGSDRQNVVMRNLTFQNMPKSVFGAGRWDVISNARYWVIDNVAFVGNGTGDPASIAVSLQTVRDLTIKNSRFADNYGQAIELTTRDATIIDTVFTNNNRNWDQISDARLKQDRNATVGFSGLDVDITRVTVEGSRYIGWRNDHVAERVTLDGCTFRNNVIGTSWEIAYGPLTIKNTTIENNTRGIQLETTYDTTIDAVTFKDNTDGAIYLTWKDRSKLRGDPNTYDSGAAGDLSKSVGSAWTYEKAMNGTRRTTIKNSTFSTTKGANSLFYRKRPEDTQPGEYRSWYADELTASNNKYYNSLTTNAFEITNASNVLTTTDLAGWRSATGSDSDSTWSNGSTTTLRNPENPASTVAGLDYKYYEGSWNALPNFDSLTAAKTGTTSGFDLSVRNRNDQFGFAFTGYINVPADGTYTFYTNSDDGSKLYIGTTEVVNNDGLHGNQERSGAIGLKAGKHALKVTFFEQGGGETLEVRYDGPGVGKQLVPNSALFRVNGSTPTSNTKVSTGGTASASSNPVSAEDAAKGFDASTSTKWLGNMTSSGAWIAYDFANSNAYVVKEFKVISANDGQVRDPKDFKLQGSNNNSSWTDIAGGSFTNQSWSGRLVTNTYSVSGNSTAYQQYRLFISANSGSTESGLGGTGLVQLSELELWGVSGSSGTTSTASTTSAKLTGTVIGTTGSYANSGNTRDKVFDGNLSTFFDAPESTGGNGAWVGLDLGSGRTITSIKYAPRSSWASRMSGGQFQVSNDQSSWTTIYTISGSPAQGSLTTQNVSVSGTWRYVRYLSPNGGWGNIAEMEVWGS